MSGGSHARSRRFKPTKDFVNRLIAIMLRRSTSRKAAMTGSDRNSAATLGIWPVAINLALQGGGAHGAFTWGVLDRLLEDGGFAPEGISGTSAGALNAVVLASGWLEGGPDGARAALERLWRKIADLARLRPLRATGLSQMAADFATTLLSPYHLNPLDLNPLRSIIEELVDFERLRAQRALQLFIAATNLRTGRGRIFRNGDLSSKAVLASACLPQLHRAVEIDGEAYWDGGFASNPPLLPLIECCRARHLVLVQINPIETERVPRTACEIRNRVGEIVFGRPLLEELARLDQAVRLAHSPLGWISPAARRLARHRLHRIDGSALLAGLEPATKTDPSWPLLERLAALGRDAAKDWLRLRTVRRPTPREWLPRPAAASASAAATPAA
jgi:NTE family protein